MAVRSRFGFVNVDIGPRAKAFDPDERIEAVLKLPHVAS